VALRAGHGKRLELLSLYNLHPNADELEDIDFIEELVSSFNFEHFRWPRFDAAWIAPLGRKSEGRFDRGNGRR
jgi:hypothetical protein